MVNKKIWLGILVILLVFGFVIMGCGDLLEDKGYTFEIAIKNDSNNNSSGWIITQIDFINGNKKDDPVLKTEMVNLSPKTTSELYKVSGFTSEVSFDKESRYCGIKVYYSNGQIGYGYGYKKNNSKFLATANNITSPPSVIIYSAL